MDSQVPVQPLDSSEEGNEEAKNQKIIDAFESAETVEEMLRAVKEMEEANVAKVTIGTSYYNIGYKMFDEGGEEEQVITYSLKALNILESCDDKSLSPLVAMNLHLLGRACDDLGRWSESLGYLERAETLLRKFEEEGRTDDERYVDAVKEVMLAVQRYLVKTKYNLDRKEDAVGNLRKCLEIQEGRFEKDSREVANASRALAKTFVDILNFGEALPYCLKALEIHELLLGNNSVDVVRDRMLLGVIYDGLEEKEKELEQKQMAQEVLKDQGLTSDLHCVVIDVADIYVEIGKNFEAVETLRSVVSLAGNESMDQAAIFVSMAKASGNQEGLKDTKRNCLEIACRILGNNEKSYPVGVCKAYEDISFEYQEMKDFENAMSLLKKSLAILQKLPEEKEFLGIATARMGWLHRSMGKMELSLSSYLDAVELLKESFGKTHLRVADAYSSIGCAYDNLDRPESAAQYYSMALEILDASFGPHHIASIKISEIISKAYSAIGNYELAIKYREKAVEAWKAHGPSRKWEQQDNQYILEELKKKAHIISEISKAASTHPL